MKVLFYCANELQGQPIVRELLKSGHQVRALVRNVSGERSRQDLVRSRNARFLLARGTLPPAADRHQSIMDISAKGVSSCRHERPSRTDISDKTEEKPCPTITPVPTLGSPTGTPA